MKTTTIDYLSEKHAASKDGLVARAISKNDTVSLLQQ